MKNIQNLVNGLRFALLIAAVALISTGARAGSHDDDVKALGSSAPSEQKKAEINLQKAGTNAIPSLLKGLDDANRDVKIRALLIMRQVLWKSRSLVADPIAKEIGRKGRAESDWVTRDEMVSTMRQMKGAATTQEMKWFASNDASQYVRRDATHFIPEVSLKNESDFLRRQTSDKSVLVQLAAYIELAKLGDISGHALALRTIKTSNDLGERQEALDLLGAVGDDSDLAMLKGISESDSDNAKFKALHAYKKIQLHQLPAPERLPSLLKALDDESPEVKRWAYYELYHSPDPNTNDALRKYLNEPGHRGHKEAADALDSR